MLGRGEGTPWKLHRVIYASILREGHGEKCFSKKRERELHFVWQSATGLIKWNSDKLHCLMDIGVAFERLGRGDKSREGSMEIWQTRGYILEFACNAILSLERKITKEGANGWMNFQRVV